MRPTSMELARKASMANMQGLKPTKRPAAKTVAIDDMVRSLRVFLAAHARALISAESLPSNAGEIRINANTNRIVLTKYRAIFWKSNSTGRDTRSPTGTALGCQRYAK